MAHARRALSAGAHRLELCTRIASGGLTPRPATNRIACSLPLPIHTMIRPRGGNFVYTRAEQRDMVRAIRVARDLGTSGIVTGSLTRAGAVDRGMMQTLLDAADGLPVTFHRAFDATPDDAEALETLISLGVHRVLTSGGGRTAWEGRTALARLVRIAGDRIGVIAAGRIRAARAGALVRLTGVRAIHAHVDRAALRALGQACYGPGTGHRPSAVRIAG